MSGVNRKERACFGVHTHDGSSREHKCLGVGLGYLEGWSLLSSVSAVLAVIFAAWGNQTAGLWLGSLCKPLAHRASKPRNSKLSIHCCEHRQLSSIRRVYPIELSCWLSRCWLSRCWLSRCWLSRCWLSRCWLSRCWLSREKPAAGGGVIGAGLDPGSVGLLLLDNALQVGA